jgi:hypothetical protein
MIWLFWLKWILATTTSAVVVNFAIQVLASLSYRVVLYSVARTLTSSIFIFLYQSLTGGILGALLFGLAVGSAQWLVLRTQIILTSRYILATSLGWGLAGILVNYNYIGIVGGIMVGIAQWLVLKRKFFQATWWMIANILGWGLSSFIGYRVFSILNPYIGIFEVAVNPGTLVVGVSTSISAAITGLVLIWLLKYKQRNSR